MFVYWFVGVSTKICNKNVKIWKKLKESLPTCKAGKENTHLKPEKDYS
jgi:hypothetical protein